MKVKVYILSGNPRQVEAVVKENRIRASRGMVKFTPYECEDSDLARLYGDNDVAEDDTKETPVADTKEPAEADTKSPKRKKTE